MKSEKNAHLVCTSDRELVWYLLANNATYDHKESIRGTNRFDFYFDISFERSKELIRQKVNDKKFNKIAKAHSDLKDLIYS